MHMEQWEFVGQHGTRVQEMQDYMVYPHHQPCCNNDVNVCEIKSGSGLGTRLNISYVGGLVKV